MHEHNIPESCVEIKRHEFVLIHIIVVSVIPTQSTSTKLPLETILK